MITTHTFAEYLLTDTCSTNAIWIDATEYGSPQRVYIAGPPIIPAFSFPPSLCRYCKQPLDKSGLCVHCGGPQE